MKKIYLNIIVFLFIFSLFGCTKKVIIEENSNNEIIEELNEDDSYKNEKILIGGETPEKENIDTFIEDLKVEVVNSIPIEYRDKVGISYFDLSSQKGFDLNGDVYFVAASTYKIPLNIVLMDKANKGEIDLDLKIEYVDLDYENGTGILQEGELLNEPISLRDLSKYSIVYSDNIASNMIYRYLGGYNQMRKDFDKLLGYETDRSDNILTPNIARDAYKLMYYSNNKYYKEILEYGKNTIFNDRISRDIPNIVSHKVGNYNGYSNDIGIVYDEKPYILCVYTNNIPNSYNTIAEISNVIYERNIDRNF